MTNAFWLSDTQWQAIEPHLPRNQPSARRVDGRRVISGIIHVLKSGCRWRDCPLVYGPYTAVYHRWNRGARRRTRPFMPSTEQFQAKWTLVSRPKLRPNKSWSGLGIP